MSPSSEGYNPGLVQVTSNAKSFCTKVESLFHRLLYVSTFCLFAPYVAESCGKLLLGANKEQFIFSSKVLLTPKVSHFISWLQLSAGWWQIQIAVKDRKRKTRCAFKKRWVHCYITFIIFSKVLVPFPKRVISYKKLKRSSKKYISWEQTITNAFKTSSVGFFHRLLSLHTLNDQ